MDSHIVRKICDYLVDDSDVHAVRGVKALRITCWRFYNWITELDIDTHYSLQNIYLPGYRIRRTCIDFISNNERILTALYLDKSDVEATVVVPRVNEVTLSVIKDQYYMLHLLYQKGEFRLLFIRITDGRIKYSIYISNCYQKLEVLTAGEYMDLYDYLADRNSVLSCAKRDDVVLSNIIRDGKIRCCGQFFIMDSDFIRSIPFDD